VLFDLAGEVHRNRSVEAATRLRSLGSVLGVLQQEPRSFLQAGQGLGEAAIQALIEERAAAKKSRDFARADQIRADLQAQGIELKDSAQGTTWVRG
jgi:cysteinyl-tRNA synthetase